MFWKKLLGKKLSKSYLVIEVESLAGSSIDDTIKILTKLSLILRLLTSGHFIFQHRFNGKDYMISYSGWYTDNDDIEEGKE